MAQATGSSMVRDVHASSSLTLTCCACCACCAGIQGAWVPLLLAPCTTCAADVIACHSSVFDSRFARNQHQHMHTHPADLHPVSPHQCTIKLSFECCAAYCSLSSASEARR